jgi:hypothetical protein
LPVIALEKDGEYVNVQIDEEDLHLLRNYSWIIDSNNYVRTSVFNSKTDKTHAVWLHRLVAGIDSYDERVVDHIDRNPLNNRRSNLRAILKEKNQKNRGKCRRNTTGFKGVTLIKKTGKYMARIASDGKRITIGTFDNQLDAAVAYNEAAIKYHGEFAALNNLENLSSRS